MAETTGQNEEGRARPSSGRADTFGKGGSGKTLSETLGSGKVLGSALTDTLAAEMCYGIDGKTELTFMGEKYIFSPIASADQDEASSDLERLPTTLLALGMVTPAVPLEDVLAADLASMIRVLSGGKETSEFAACQSAAILCMTLDTATRHTLTRLTWYCLRRFAPDLEFEKVLPWVDTANAPYLLRLYFRKNIGVLDRFLLRLMQLVPPAPETTEADLQEVPTVNPAEMEALMSAAQIVVGESGATNQTPQAHEDLQPVPDPEPQETGEPTPTA